MGAIRIFLALGVVIGHLHDQVLSHLGLSIDPRWMFNIVGGRSVVFFYVVSGFLISHVLRNKYPSTAAGARAFFRSRFLRIYPVWWALLIACFTIGLEPGAVTWLPAAVLLGSDWLVAFWHYPEQFWFFFPHGSEIGWTLGAELTFYAMAPWLLRSLTASVGLLILSAMCRGIAFWWFGPGTHSYLNWSYFFFPSTLMFFLLGHFANVLHDRIRLGLPTALFLLLITASGFALYSVPITVDYVTDYVFCFCFALALPAIFAATKDNRAFNFLGDLTYPIYLTHALVISALFWPWEIIKPIGDALVQFARFFDAGWLQSVFLLMEATALILTVAALVHLFIENPLRAAAEQLLKWFERSPPASITPAPIP